MTLFADLPGAFTLKTAQSADYFASNRNVVLVEQDLAPFGRLAGWITVDPHFLEDLERGGMPLHLEDFIEHALAHVFRPWAFRDEPDFLDFFDPVPKLSRALELARRVPILLRSSKRRWDVLDDAAYLTARRLRRAADRLDARFEARRSS